MVPQVTGVAALILVTRVTPLAPSPGIVKARATGALTTGVRHAPGDLAAIAIRIGVRHRLIQRSVPSAIITSTNVLTTLVRTQMALSLTGGDLMTPKTVDASVVAQLTTSLASVL